MQKAKVAYVLPEDYGFALRRSGDRNWGLFEAYQMYAKVLSDLNKLVELYDFGLDIIYDELGVVGVPRIRYERVFFWNETIP